MKLREFLTVFEQSDRLRIVKNEKDVYTGFLALMAHAGNMEALMDAEVKRFRPTPEIRHKEWQNVGLWHRCNRRKRRNIPFQICR